MKRKYVLLLFPLLTLALSAMAQEETDIDDGNENKIFRFVYVAPDNTMTQQRLLADLNDHRNHVVSEGSPAIFYLASGHDPIVVKFKLDDDNSDDFESQMLGFLKQSMSTNVEASYDRQHIRELLSQYDFIDEEGNLTYKKMEFDFHVGNTFWSLHNNETVIAALFFEMNIAKYMEDDKVQFNVYFRCPPSRGDYNREKPFGELNPDNINERVIPQSTD